MTVASQLKVQYSDNSEQSFDLGYQPFFVTGDEVPDGKGGKIWPAATTTSTTTRSSTAPWPAASATSSPMRPTAPRC